MKSKIFFQVTSQDSAKRLDVFLSQKDPALSRSQIKRLIERGEVQVGGRKAKAALRLRENDAVTLTLPEPQKLELEAQAIPLEVLYEDRHLIVVDKPAGLVVHPGAGNYSGTLVNALLHRCPDLAGIGGVLRPGIVHRLDKDTSGLILVAKNDRAHRDLQSQFKGREVEKSYLALAYGIVSPPSGEIAAAVGRDDRQRKRMAVVPGGRAALTRYETLGYYGKTTLLACRPLTGRTHQIRVHLAHIGHPIVGDAVYGGRRPGSRPEKRGIFDEPGRSPGSRDKPPVPCPRQFLHAHRIRFRLPGTGEQVEFTAPLPADLQAVLDALGRET